MALITGMDSVPHLQIWLLGTFRVRIDSHRVTELDKRLRAAELLKLLALSPTCAVITCCCGPQIECGLTHRPLSARPREHSKVVTAPI